MKKLLIIVFMLATGKLNAQNYQKAASGRIEHIENFRSAITQPRNIDIWLPEGYDGKKKFAVLYMHDGQMLFDSTTSWNHQSWNVDDIAGPLLKAHEIRNFIVVGIWNRGPGRHPDYFPQKPFESLTQSEKDTVTKQLQRAGRVDLHENFQSRSDSYLKFLVTELKPMIDNNYSVFTDRKHTFIAGSNMGGLISWYALCEYPLVFGGAACLSTHWPGTFTNEHNPVPDAFTRYLKDHLPYPRTHKLYFDCGDQSLDAFYPPYQEKVDEVLKLKGYLGKNRMTRYFKGKDHSERSWNERFEIPLRFLLKK